MDVKVGGIIFSLKLRQTESLPRSQTSDLTSHTSVTSQYYFFVVLCYPPFHCYSNGCQLHVGRKPSSSCTNSSFFDQTFVLKKKIELTLADHIVSSDRLLSLAMCGNAMGNTWTNYKCLLKTKILALLIFFMVGARDIGLEILG